MSRRKRKINKIKVLVVLILLLVVVRIIRYTFSIFESNSNGTANVNIAYYVLNDDYQEMTLNLGTLLPRDNPYVYTFSVANYNGLNRTDTKLEYNVKLRTTTNLPLQIELYENENYSDSGSQDILSVADTRADEHGTYFTTYTTPTSYFGFQTMKKIFTV